MYEGFFGLARRPFSPTSDATGFFPAPTHNQALLQLSDCVKHQEGIGLLIAGAGLGKTLLCQLLVQNLAADFQSVWLTHAHFATPRALLQAILFELDQPYRDMDEQELRLALRKFLTPPAPVAPSLLLVVDEAHLLSGRLLEELRLLTTWSVPSRPLVRLVLAGQPLLEEQLATAEMLSLNQHISRRSYLEPFTAHQTADYIAHRLRWAGGDGRRILTPDSLDAIYRATEGVPRWINLLCDQALMLAFVRKECPLGADTVSEAWQELQHLPPTWAPSHGGSAPSPDQQSVVEFGEEVPFSAEAEDQVAEETPSSDLPRTAPIGTGESRPAQPMAPIAQAQPQSATPPHEWTISAARSGKAPSHQPRDASEPEISPLVEKFQEEELVSDRYAACEAPSYPFEAMPASGPIIREASAPHTTPMPDIETDVEPMIDEQAELSPADAVLSEPTIGPVAGTPASNEQRAGSRTKNSSKPQGKRHRRDSSFDYRHLFSHLAH